MALQSRIARMWRLFLSALRRHRFHGGLHLLRIAPGSSGMPVGVYSSYFRATGLYSDEATDYCACGRSAPTVSAPPRTRAYRRVCPGDPSRFAARSGSRISDSAPADLEASVRVRCGFSLRSPSRIWRSRWPHRRDAASVTPPPGPSPKSPARVSIRASCRAPGDARRRGSSLRP